MKNPYTISFGKEPTQLVSRISQINKIVDDFSEDNPSYQACIISGIRGIGKTVTLSEICNRIKEDNRWVVVNLNSGMDLFQSLAAKLYNSKPLLGIFDSANIERNCKWKNKRKNFIYIATFQRICRNIYVNKTRSDLQSQFVNKLRKRSDPFLCSVFIINYITVYNTLHLSQKNPSLSCNHPQLYM